MAASADYDATPVDAAGKFRTQTLEGRVLTDGTHTFVVIDKVAATMCGRAEWRSCGSFTIPVSEFGTGSTEPWIWAPSHKPQSQVAEQPKWLEDKATGHIYPANDAAKRLVKESKQAQAVATAKARDAALSGCSGVSYDTWMRDEWHQGRIGSVSNYRQYQNMQHQRAEWAYDIDAATREPIKNSLVIELGK